MPFDIERFANTQMTRRTERIPCPDLAAFFGEGEEAVWEIQTLTAAELCRCNDAKERASSMGNILEAIGQGAKVDEMRKALGLTKDTPAEIAKRIQLLVEGSLLPKVNHEQAVLFAERFGSDFYHITNKILILTGSGFDIAKPVAASPKTQA
jgi:hypothetical protein